MEGRSAEGGRREVEQKIGRMLSIGRPWEHKTKSKKKRRRKGNIQTNKKIVF